MLFSWGFPPTTLYVIFLIYSLFQGAIYLYFAKRECGISIKSYFDDVVVKAVVPSLIILLIVLVPYNFIEVEPYRLLFVVVVNTFAFLLTIWFVGLSKIEKDFLLQIVKRK